MAMVRWGGGGGGGNLRLSDVRCKRGSKTSNENELERVSPVINWKEKNWVRVRAKESER